MSSRLTKFSADSIWALHTRMKSSVTLIVLLIGFGAVICNLNNGAGFSDPLDQAFLAAYRRDPCRALDQANLPLTVPSILIKSYIGCGTTTSAAPQTGKIYTNFLDPEFLAAYRRNPCESLRQTSFPLDVGARLVSAYIQCDSPGNENASNSNSPLTQNSRASQQVDSNIHSQKKAFCDSLDQIPLPWSIVTHTLCEINQCPQNCLN